MRLRNQDKQRMVGLFLADPELAKFSNVEIAKRVGVATNTVKNHRDSILAKSQDSKPTTRTATRKGKTYVMETEAIGKKAEPEATEQPYLIHCFPACVE